MEQKSFQGRQTVALSDHTMMIDILLEHNARYPAWQVEDVYKLLHQASFGSEHAVADEARARRWLEEELAALTAVRVPEVLLEPITPDGAVLRVHLRPYAARGLAPELLLGAFLRTAREFKGEAALLEEGWDAALMLAGEGRLPFDAGGLREWGERMRGAGYPAVHHSEAYARVYRPAYRVVAAECLPAELRGG